MPPVAALVLPFCLAMGGAARRIFLSQSRIALRCRGSVIAHLRRRVGLISTNLHRLHWLVPLIMAATSFGVILIIHRGFGQWSNVKNSAVNWVVSGGAEISLAAALVTSLSLFATFAGGLSACC